MLVLLKILIKTTFELGTNLTLIDSEIEKEDKPILAEEKEASEESSEGEDNE